MLNTPTIDPIQLAPNTAKKTKPVVPSTPAPLQSLLKPKTQQPQAPTSNIAGGIPGIGLSAVNNPLQTGTKYVNKPTPKVTSNTLPQQLPKTGSYDLGELSEKEIKFMKVVKDQGGTLDDALGFIKQKRAESQGGQTSKVAQGAKNILGATLETATGLPRLAGGLVGEGVGAIAKGLGANKEKTDKLVDDWKQSLKKNQDIGQNRASGLFKGVKLAGDIINTATPMGFSKSATLAEKVGSIPKVADIASKLPSGLVGKIAKGVAGGLADVTKFTGISDSRLPSLKELAIGGIIGGVAPLVGAGISKLATKKPKVVEDIVGQVIQGSKKDIKPAIETLSKVETKGVKTYEQLGTKISESNKKLMQAVDGILENDNRLVTPDMFVKTVQAGDETVTTNYVTKAIDHLDELYTKTDDIDSQAMIKNTRSLFEQGKLKLKDINDVLRIYSSEFGDKAFSKATQEPLTSVSAQQYENVRKGAKEMLRSQFADDGLKLLDEQYSKGAKTLELVNKMSDKVQKLQQKLNDRPFLEKAGRLVGRGVDFITGGGLRGLLTSFLPSNIGNKVMNSLDLQEKLITNLDEIEKLLNKVDMGTASKFDLEFIKKYATTLSNIGGASMGEPAQLKK